MQTVARTDRASAAPTVAVMMPAIAWFINILKHSYVKKNTPMFKNPNNTTYQMAIFSLGLL